jgi:mannitol/fructose-specific phosphotransferase system IIA component (Ntr-type)
MKKVINQLVQLQELVEARIQQETLVGKGRLDELNRSIETMIQALPPETAGQFQRLLKRSYLAVVPLNNGVCAGCGMKVPVSLAHAVHAALQLLTCTNCSRFLYYPESGAPRRTPGAPSAGATNGGIARFTHPELMLPALSAKTRDEAVAEICAKMQASGFIDNAAALTEAALRRESIMSTAVDHGIAFPHVRGVEGGGLTLAVGLSPRGIRFTPESKSLTRIIFFVAIPTAASAFYLKLLAGLTKTFEKATHREKLFAAETPEDLWKALKTATRSTIL